MSIVSFVIILVFLLVTFQGLQIYFFYRRQLIVGGLFVLFFWTAFGFMVYSGGILFASNYSGSGAVKPKTVIIPRGATLRLIAEKLHGNGIVRNERNFLWAAKLLGLENKLKAGKFVVVETMSNYSLVHLLATSESAVQEQLTIIEGIGSKEIAGLIANSMDLDSTKFMNIVFDSAFAASHSIEANNLEGYLYPETYRFTYGVSEKEIIEAMLGEFRKHVDDALTAKIGETGMTLHDVITLASIIEGEAVFDDERPLISAVYHNRLDKGMRLQADPTVQYVIPDGPRRLLLDDLKIDSPYNTYVYGGLPPGPINNPGIQSIRAAVEPADESYLFFVATGDGRHTFTHTQAEHLEAKKRLDQIRRDYYRDSRRIK